jgi:hypothetical protein
MRPLRVLPALLAVSLLSTGCFGYRLMRPEEIEIPNYDPRPVAIPAECETLITRAAERGMANMTEGEARMVDFCQQQHVIRAQEEETAARRLDAHARAADFALHLTVTLITATVAILAWVF